MFSLIGPVTRVARVGIFLDTIAASLTLILSYVFLFMGCLQTRQTGADNVNIVYVVGGFGFAVLYFALSSGVATALSALVLKPG